MQMLLTIYNVAKMLLRKNVKEHQSFRSRRNLKVLLFGLKAASVRCRNNKANSALWQKKIANTMHKLKNKVCAIRSARLGSEMIESTVREMKNKSCASRLAGDKR